MLQEKTIVSKKISPNKKKKISQALEFKKIFDESKSLIVYNFHNWDHQSFLDLKKNLKTNGGFVKVFKNKIVEKALGEKKITGSLKNNNAFVFSSDDNDLNNLKIIHKMALSQGQSNPFEWAIYNDELINKETLQSWSRLPNKKQLILQIINSLQFPLFRIRNLINQIEVKKTSEKI